jgi:hypothetical protein
MAITHSSSATQSDVMQLLLAAHPALLSRDEIRREVGSASGLDEALEHFVRLGLVHQCDDFFWASRTMMAAEEAATAHLVLDSRDAEKRQ